MGEKFDIVKALRSVDHMSVEDCFLQSPLFSKAADEIERLKKEIRYLRHYGNKDCTWMADEAMSKDELDT